MRSGNADLRKARLHTIGQLYQDDVISPVSEIEVKSVLVILYLESGNIPIKSRRLNFLFYILHENNDSLIRNVFDAQRKSPLKGDWVNTVKEDLESLNIDQTFEDIEQMEKESFKTLVRERVRQTAFEHLKQTQASMSKGKEIVYKDLSLQLYLKPNSNLSIKDKAFIFSART